MLPLVHRIDPPIFPQNRQASANIDRSSFINTGLWVSTVVFIGIAISFAAISASFSIINVLFNPIEPVFSVFGLYIWNGVALGSTALCMIMWGALFASTLTDNIAITDTLTTQIPYSSDGLASLGRTAPLHSPFSNGDSKTAKIKMETTGHPRTNGLHGKFPREVAMQIDVENSSRVESPATALNTVPFRINPMEAPEDSGAGTAEFDACAINRFGARWSAKHHGGRGQPKLVLV
uniref:Uncharacterized protein n=1 Tax=Anopheles merus TaxID=30066 RepID=A0A182UX00_ANOME